ncbi:MAG: PilW family protein [Burkholderiaceae bacterium]
MNCSSGHPRFRTIDRHRRGFTLVELMVSLVIGLAVVGVLSAAYVASVQSGRHNDAMAQIAEDATLALGVMRQQVAQAGFGTPIGSGPAGFVLHPSTPVLGCEAANFRDPATGILGPPTCNASAADPSTPDALEVAYEASVLPSATSNGILGGRARDEPLDCLGNTFAKTHDPVDGDYYLVDSKFYVSAGNLVCHGPGNPAGAALVQNVETLQVTYGMSAVAPGAAGSNQVAYYDVAPPIGSPAWANVVAVSICVQVRSAGRVLDAGSAATLGSWIDCRNALKSSTDGYLRRTFSTTIVLQNKLL